jgi:hypothetical protein
MNMYRVIVLVICLGCSGISTAQSGSFCELTDLKKLFRYSDIKTDTIIHIVGKYKKRSGLVYVNRCKKIISYHFNEDQNTVCSGVYLDHEELTPIDVVLLADTVVYGSFNDTRVATYYIEVHEDFTYWYYMGQKFGERFFYCIGSGMEGKLPEGYTMFVKQAQIQYDYPPYVIIDTIAVGYSDMDSMTMQSSPSKIPYFINYDKCNLTGVYVDSSSNKVLYSMLRYYNSDGDTYSSMMNDIPGKKKYKLNKKLLTRIPSEMVELGLYQDKWYLYAPSDWGTLGRASITDSTFVDYNMDGPWPKVIKRITETDPGVYILELIGQGSDYKYDLVVRFLDIKRGIFLLGFKNPDGIVYDRMMCDADKMDQFPCIVNYSPKEKAREFQFDVPDYQRLIFQYGK